MRQIASFISSVLPGKVTQRHLPGEEGVWIFIFGDMMIFAVFFSTFMYYRGENLEIFQRSQALLNINLGTLNTLLLLASSWFVVIAMEAVRQSRIKLAANLFSGAFLFGLSFCLVKIIEYSEKVSAGYTLNTDLFFTLYFVFTGVHLFHVILGLIVLSLIIRSCRNDEVTGDKIRFFEGGSCFWHMVDLLWIVLFPLLYLVD